MKKILLFILSVLLFGCFNNKIDISHTNEGFTIEPIGSIHKGNADNFYISSFDENGIHVKRSYSNGTTYDYYVDINENTVYQTNAVDDNNKILLFENDEYKIFMIIQYQFKVNGVVTTKFYCYEKDGRLDILYSTIDDGKKAPILYDVVIKHPTSDEALFILEKNNDYLSLCEIKDGMLNEIDTIARYRNDSAFINCFKYQDTLAYVYENEDEKLVVIDNQETIYEKYKDDYELTFFSVEEDGIVTKYENDKEILYTKNNDKQTISKNIDDYQLIEVYPDGKIYIYLKENLVRLVVDGNTYDLGNQAQYRIKEDYILSTYLNNDTNEYETIYIHRKSNKVYSLSEKIELFDSYNLEDTYLITDYSNVEYPNRILKIEDKEMIFYDLPLDINYKYACLISENKAIYTLETSEEISFYLVTISE